MWTQHPELISLVLHGAPLWDCTPWCPERLGLNHSPIKFFVSRRYFPQTKIARQGRGSYLVCIIIPQNTRIAQADKLTSWPADQLTSGRTDTWRLTADNSLLTIDTWQLATESWQLTTDNWQLTTDNWRLTADNWQLTIDTWQLATESWQLTTDSWQLTADSWQLTIVS